MKAKLRDRARAILADNDWGGYTVPTAGLYPFQWNWDSAFVAMGFSTFDIPRAFRELEMLASGQWDDGLIAHITFHKPSDSYFPGPDVWRTAHKRPAGAPPSAGITQPPVFGIALRRVHAAAAEAGLTDADGRTRPLFEAALRHHRWWLSARDPDGIGLVAVLHNWETGSDNSPAWDAALARVPTTTTTPVRRKDTGHVDAAMRPRDIDYQRYIHLVDAYAAVGWEPKEQWRIAPFKVAEVQTTAILARATEDLLALADIVGTAEELRELEGMRQRLTAGLRRRWRPALGRFCSLDLISGEDIETPTQAGFMPLIALDLDAGQRKAIAAELTRWLDASGGVLPSVPPFSPDFDAKRYWRGPVWAVINWLLIDGLERNGMPEMAARVRDALLGLIERQGFSEYFDPLTGEGCGGDGFSWTAAAYLHLTRNGGSDERQRASRGSRSADAGRGRAGGALHA